MIDGEVWLSVVGASSLYDDRSSWSREKYPG
jgi:hypothetical protein